MIFLWKGLGIYVSMRNNNQEGEKHFWPIFSDRENKKIEYQYCLSSVGKTLDTLMYTWAAKTGVEVLSLVCMLIINAFEDSRVSRFSVFVSSWRENLEKNYWKVAFKKKSSKDEVDKSFCPVQLTGIMES